MPSGRLFALGGEGKVEDEERQEQAVRGREGGGEEREREGGEGVPIDRKTSSRSACDQDAFAVLSCPLLPSSPLCLPPLPSLCFPLTLSSSFTLFAYLSSRQRRPFHQFGTTRSASLRSGDEGKVRGWEESKTRRGEGERKARGGQGRRPNRSQDFWSFGAAIRTLPFPSPTFLTRLPAFPRFPLALSSPLLPFAYLPHLCLD